MFNARERNYQKTKIALFEALERLKKSQPTNRELQKKLAAGKLKINRSSVEKEARLSVGVLRNHDDVVDAIKSATFISAKKASEADTGEANDVVQLKAMKDKLKKAKDNAREQARLKQKHYENAKRDEAALRAQVAQQAMIVQALLRKVPAHEREKAIHEIVRAKGNNVVSLKVKQ
ncbi:bacterioferritin comigratory protein [Vibrio parahaemolyticus]|nr:bacterioferritin comigratory protein [Vibrio parahaemolyticus]EGR0686853.1 bacterioferritin comigratory protein [Vibrio parahaemolyticus]